MTEHDTLTVRSLEVFENARATRHGPSQARASVDHIVVSRELAPQAEWAKVSSSWCGMQTRVDHLP
eukprot:4163690-Lingulodinium_polyedra.AAC.1